MFTSAEGKLHQEPTECQGADRQTTHSKSDDTPNEIAEPALHLDKL
jgi:hypothetical protein